MQRVHLFLKLAALPSAGPGQAQKLLGHPSLARRWVVD